MLTSSICLPFGEMGDESICCDLYGDPMNLVGDDTNLFGEFMNFEGDLSFDGDPNLVGEYEYLTSGDP